MRDTRVVEQTTVSWISEPFFVTYDERRQVRIAYRWQRIIEDGEQRTEHRYRAETRRVGFDWLPVGDSADWLPGEYSAWAVLDSAVRVGRVKVWPELARTIAWHTHNAEWAIGSDEVHEDAIFEDKVRTLAAAFGRDALLEIVSSGQLLEVLRSQQKAA